MFALREIGLVALREVRRNLRSKKGVAMSLLFLTGGAIPTMIQLFFRKLQTDAGGASLTLNGPEDPTRPMRRMMLARAYSEEIADYLVDCPTVLLFLLKGTLFFLPLLILLIGFDQIAGEVQHRSLRYVAGRAHRTSIVVGKAAGTWVVVASMALILHATVWIAMIARSEAPAGDVLSWGGRLWLFCVAQGVAYVGLTTLVSSFFRTPTLALFTGLGMMVALSITNFILGLIEATKMLTWAFPGTYEDLLISPDPLVVARGIGLFVLWGGVCVALASAITSRRDV
ncbi:ABC transporter permease subunit [Chondromyces apiculatus]|uniref:Uncharacterized protein n=1 Tax=Chondromyces apiculatus DSM 436 TaxID=1192034 RepID=A0A017SY05_9BACT|nr:ABC transporter permease subunit [Chondromyces apiculatus]EYF01490.1 Hypothetical protein CAP_8051 [Chondromyces apiculatus DSM 436]